MQSHEGAIISASCTLARHEHRARRRLLLGDPDHVVHHATHRCNICIEYYNWCRYPMIAFMIFAFKHHVMNALLELERATANGGIRGAVPSNLLSSPDTSTQARCHQNDLYSGHKPGAKQARIIEMTCPAPCKVVVTNTIERNWHLVQKSTLHSELDELYLFNEEVTAITQETLWAVEELSIGSG